MAFVRVVVVNFDGGAVTMRCIDALLRTEHPAGQLEIVVVDNASSDGVVGELRRDHPDVRVLVNAANEGFARGCNVAMQDLGGVDFVALINNDTVVEPGWLAPLLAAAAPVGVGAVCPKLLLNVHARSVVLEAPLASTLPDGRRVGVGMSSLVVDGVDILRSARPDERFWPGDNAPDDVKWTRRASAAVWWPVDEHAAAVDVTVGLVTLVPTCVGVGDGITVTAIEVEPPGAEAHRRIESVGRIINSTGGALYDGWHGGDRGFLEPDVGQYDEPDEVFAWCGGAVLLKTEYLHDVGLFDPTFFLYYEDFDMSWRGRSRGWRYLYEPGSRVFHEHMYSSKPGSEFHRSWSDRNRRLTLVKNAPATVAARAVAGVFVAVGRDFLRLGRGTSFVQLRTRAREAWRVLDGVPHALRERRRITRSRLVGPDEIRRWMTTK